MAGGRRLMTEPTRRVVITPLNPDGSPRGEPWVAEAESIRLTMPDGGDSPFKPWGSVTVEFDRVDPELFHLVTGGWSPGTPRWMRIAWAVRQQWHKVRGKWRR